MAAGLGFKDFTTGEVLTAADVDGYLMQGVWVFASAAARDAAVTSPQEGNFAYLKDTNVTTYYTGSAWANLDTTGMTNPMTTTGDTIYSSSGSTPARLGIGSTGDVLTVAAGVPSWAAPASGGMTLINTGGTALSGSSTTISTIPSGYNELRVYVVGFQPSSNAAGLQLRFNGDSGANRHKNTQTYSAVEDVTFDDTIVYVALSVSSTGTNGLASIYIPQYANTSTWKIAQSQSISNSYLTSTKLNMWQLTGMYNQTTAITSLEFRVPSGTFSGGTVYVYGVK